MVEGKDDADHFDALEKTGFFGSAGAGCLFVARDTGRFLFSHRSQHVEQPGDWAGWGGAIDSGEDPVEAVKREVHEEAGYNGKMDLIPIHGFKGEVHVQRKAVAKGDAHNLKGAKIGINPTSDYNTPLGIYCYPVDYVIEKMEGGQSVEFGAERPYMWIFKSVGKVADLADYTQADLEEDCKKLGIDANDRFAKNVFRDALVHTPGGYFWAITRDKALNRARSKLQAEYEAKEDEREAAAQEKKDAAWDEFQTDYSNNKGIL
ncbi:unnamed protein product [Sphagnum tenellum]